MIWLGFHAASRQRHLSYSNNVCHVHVQVMYNGSQAQLQMQTSTAWAAAWLTNLNSNQQPPSAVPALQRLSMQSIAGLRSAALHPAVSEVLTGLAVVPGMRFVLQCISSAAYARIIAGADLGIFLGQQQVSKPGTA